MTTRVVPRDPDEPRRVPAQWGEMARAIERAQEPEQPPCCVFLGPIEAGDEPWWWNLGPFDLLSAREADGPELGG